MGRDEKETSKFTSQGNEAEDKERRSEQGEGRLEMEKKKTRI